MIPIPESLQRWLPVGLLVSLGLNLFLGGFLLARGFEDSGRRSPPANVDFRLRALPPGLPAEVHEQIADAMHEKRRELRETASEYRHQQGEIARLLKEAEVDEVALQEAYKELRKLNVEIQGPIHDALILSMKEIEPEMRRAFIDKSFDGKEITFRGVEGVSGKRWRFSVRRDGDAVEIDTEIQGSDEEGGENTNRVIIIEKKVVREGAPEPSLW